jgi:hypothetical protein
MTRHDLAVELTKAEKGKAQVNIAQMSEILKCLNAFLNGKHGIEALKALLK